MYVPLIVDETRNAMHDNFTGGGEGERNARSTTSSRNEAINLILIIINVIRHYRACVSSIEPLTRLVLTSAIRREYRSKHGAHCRCTAGARCRLE